MSHLLRFLLLLALCVMPVAAKAQEPGRNVEIRLLAQRGLVAAGDEIWIAIEQSIRPHWHTYWQNPGDSGTPPRIDWTLPEGFEISEINWPTPQKIPYDPLLNYGYENSAILLQKLTVPDEIPEGPLVLTANIEILVCQVECIPEYSSHTLTLNGPAAASEKNETYLARARTRLPQKVGWDATFKETDNNLQLTLTPSNPTIFNGLTPDMITAFPVEWGMIDNPAPATVAFEEANILITQKRGERPLTETETAGFVIAIGKGETQLSYEISALAQIPVIKLSENTELMLDTAPAAESGTTLLAALFLALAGGLILNLMPCVFPVLSLKALSLVKIADKDPAQARLHGLAYTAGIILSFLSIALSLILFKAAGAGVGWGFQLQNPLIVGLLSYLFFVIALSLFGVFELGSSLTNFGNNLIQGEGLTASFMTGVLATIVATPCTAPFMAAAIGYALTQTALLNLLIFAALGLGLALPYLLLAFSPKLEKMLPKPGPWMERFKQLMAFPMLLSAAWLVWVVTQQSAPASTLYLLTGMTAIALSVWIMRGSNKFWTRAVSLFSLLLAFALLLMIPPAPEKPQAAPDSENAAWEIPFTPDSLQTALQSPHPVFTEMTAAWCITCKVNHATSINTDATKNLFAANNVQYLLGDWTNQNPEITKYLNTYGRDGVPLYIFYGRPDTGGKRPAPVILPQILTPGIIAQTIKGEP